MKEINNLESKLKKGFQKGKRNLKKLFSSALAIGSLALSGMPNDANSQVRFYMEPETPFGTPYRRFIPGVDLIIKVYADNTAETNATQGLQWSIQAPEGISFFAQTSPKPHYETNDFFDGFQMDPSHNKIGKSINDRFIVLDSSNISTNSGPYKKTGLIGRYRYTIEKTSSLGQKAFTFLETKAIDVNGNKQSSIGEKSSIIVTDNYEYLDKNPLVFFDVDNGTMRVYETAVSTGRRVLQRSNNLINWNNVLTNSASFEGLSYRENINGNPSVFFRGTTYPAD